MTLRVPPGYVLLRVPDSHRGLDRVRQVCGKVALYCACGAVFDRYGVVIVPAELEAELRGRPACTKPRKPGGLWLWWASSDARWPGDDREAWSSRARAETIGAIVPTWTLEDPRNGL